MDNILTINNDISQLLLTEIDDEIIEYLFSFDIDEETLETVRALLNHNIDPVLFSKYLGYLKNQEDNYFKIAEDNQDLVIELIASIKLFIPLLRILNFLVITGIFSLVANSIISKCFAFSFLSIKLTNLLNSYRV